uniref:Uncharacterized protein n=1 Tax=Branchiostoma floridae TaxID=7739 RepID=C3YAY0_BRAFL|eukprot:XP_002606571.1 hypothetical protein BRAFLDRAFT_108187 [Branchiostoma floridae]
MAGGIAGIHPRTTIDPARPTPVILITVPTYLYPYLGTYKYLYLYLYLGTYKYLYLYLYLGSNHVIVRVEEQDRPPPPPHPTTIGINTRKGCLLARSLLYFFS